MTKLGQAARSTVYAFALMTSGFAAQAMMSPFWNAEAPPAIIGPWLGDKSFNIGSWWVAYTSGQGKSFSPWLAAAQVGDPVGCLQLGSSAMHEIRFAASPGFVCLPQAGAPGRRIVIGNRTNQPMTIIPAPGDAINGAAMNYMANGTVIKCFVAAPNNNWYCGTSS
jgi:hypothetical protein